MIPVWIVFLGIVAAGAVWIVVGLVKTRNTRVTGTASIGMVYFYFLPAVAIMAIGGLGLLVLGLMCFVRWML